ncbi:MAG: diguanylate cyclase [Candidatus Dormibacteraeota bacterium]|nr:diguanylate cyclase [Candidatus Dormibacteraeota bacterium]MBV9526621.1 diguanylate cyclase [Candidatus Dormibacteraeota bacterium]
MGSRDRDARLDLLTRLGQRLPEMADPEAAASEVAQALTALRVYAAVSAIQGDTAVVLAVTVPENVDDPGAASAGSLVGMRVPVEGIEAMRQTVRLRRPYAGAAGATETLRRISRDSALRDALPRAEDEGLVVSVPVISRGSVVATLAVWGPGARPELAPTLEAAAAMLAPVWAAQREPAAQRFNATPFMPVPEEVRASIDSLLGSSGIAAALQPIARLHDGSVIGYEALARYAPRPYLSNPDELFALASSLSVQADVDLACLRAAVRAAGCIGAADLFVNVLTGTVLDARGMAELIAAVRDAHLDPRSVVLEFSEREPVEDLAQLQRAAAQLRAEGFRIAVDDAGAGHASMRIIAELRPEFIKVDRSLIRSVESDGARRALVVALLSFSGHIGARVIAEGIETHREQETLLSLGVQFGQGWFVGRPVLTAPLEGHPSTEVVDETWFSRRSVASTRTAPPAPAPVAEVPKTSAPSRRRSLARALSDAASALQSEHDPLRILGVMAEHMGRVVPVSEMAIFVADYETHRFVPVLAVGEDRDEILANGFSLDAGLTGWAFAGGKPQRIADSSKHPNAIQVPGTQIVEESLLLVPLVAGEHKLGIINCWRLGTAQFSDRDLEAASLFAHVAASAWRNAQLYAELVNAAMTDPLTHLYNSRWLRDAGDRDLMRAAREGKSVSLLLVDLDHFKTVNDNAGHAAGDLMLQRVANRLRTVVRGSDAVVRLGGEEFVVLLHDCDADAATRVGETVRNTVRDVPVPAACALEELTASIGVAAYPDHGDELEVLLAAADRAMYAAKASGRDRIQVAVRDGERSAMVRLDRQRASRRRAS